MTYALVDERIPREALEALRLEGFTPLLFSKIDSLGEAVSSHPDMLAFVYGKSIITNRECYDKCRKVFLTLSEGAGADITVTEEGFSPDYPSDAIFNALVIGNKIFIKTDTASPAVLSLAQREELTPVHTRQGYPACTVLAFGSAAITSDKGMARLLRKEGVRVTEICTGGISLPPHEYGFIGGASGVFENKVYFIGDLDSHPDGGIIKEAILAEGYTPVSLSKTELLDLGRIVFVG